MSVSRPHTAAFVADTTRRSSANAPQRSGAARREVAMSGLQRAGSHRANATPGAIIMRPDRYGARPRDAAIQAGIASLIIAIRHTVKRRFKRRVYHRES